MSKNKTSKPKPLTLTSVVAIASLVISLTLFLVVVGERNRLNTLYDQEAEHSMSNYYKTARITFCYENNVRPCSDNAIAEWNTQHPEDAFNITGL